MKNLESLFEIIKTLRSENGCAWDKKQTPATMFKCLAEELFELQDAIVKDDVPNICEEIGDALFQLLFIIEIYQEQKKISLDQIIEQVSKKMIGRHPHVYSNENIKDEEQLNENWERIKKEEKRKAGKKQNASALDSVPSGLPSLLKAYKISKCAVKAGFDWDDMPGVIKTLKDEIQEFEDALQTEDKKAIMLEIGDVFFTLVNVSRFADIHPETALAFSTNKFEERFRIMEKKLLHKDKKLKSLPRDEIDKLWEEAKQIYDR